MHVGLSLMTEPPFVAAAMPLLEAGEVEVVEWSFDTTWGSGPPAWLQGLLDHFGDNDRLLGHGVSWSMLSAEWTPRHQQWLDKLRVEVATNRYQHVSEHFGWMTAGRFSRGAPMPLPYTPQLVQMGQQRMLKLKEAAGVPIGLELLALAFNRRDVLEQGRFLDDLLRPVDGFLLLDVHNLYCQLHNFRFELSELLDSLPLQRVRQIHVSGGSWDGQFRRDTHDHAVPDEVIAVLEGALQRCPNVRAVIFERLGDTLADPTTHEPFRADFRRIAEVVHGG